MPFPGPLLCVATANVTTTTTAMSAHVPRSYAIALATGLFFLDKPIITPGSRMGSRREAHQQWQAI